MFREPTFGANAPQTFAWTPETRNAVPLGLPDGFVAAVNGCCKTINDRREIVDWMFRSLDKF
jgi:hypothetical protein